MGLPSSLRIKTQSEFDLVRRHGRKIVTQYFILNYFFNTNLTSPKIGIIASKKIGKAHDRNRAKRILREAIRQNINNFKQNLMAVFVSRDQILELTSKELETIIANIQDLKKD